MAYCTVGWETPLVCKRLTVKSHLRSLKIVILNECLAPSKLRKLLYNYNGTIIYVTTEDTIPLQMKFLRLRNMKYLLLLVKERSTESIQIFLKKLKIIRLLSSSKKELGTILLSFKKLKKVWVLFYFYLGSVFC